MLLFAVNMLLCCTGWISDASTVHNFATNAALSYRENFGDAISAYALGLATANAMHNRLLVVLEIVNACNYLYVNCNF